MRDDGDTGKRSKRRSPPAREAPLGSRTDGPYWPDLIGVGVAELLPDGRFVHVNKRLCAMLGYSRSALLALSLPHVIASDAPPQQLHDLASRPANKTDSVRACIRLVRRDGTLLWANVTARRSTRSVHKSSFVVTFVDATEYKELENRLAESETRTAVLKHAARGELLAWELNHRLLNLFPVIQTLVKLLGQKYPAAIEYQQALEQRLRALAVAEELMHRSESGSAGLEELVRAQLLPFEDIADILVEGPAVALRGATAQSFEIVLHELTTNAAKHGSLSAPSGQLRVIWQLTSDKRGERYLVFEWLERGGPPVSPTRQPGFGTMILNESGELLGGTAGADYAPEGLSYRLELPLPHAGDSDASGVGTNVDPVRSRR